MSKKENDSYKKDDIDESDDSDKRLEIVLKELKFNHNRIEGIKKIADPKQRLEFVIKELNSDSYKVEFIKKIKNPEKRLETALAELRKDEYKEFFIEEIENPQKRLAIALKHLEEDEYKIKIIKTIDASKIKEILEELEDSDKVFVVENIDNSEIKLEVLDMFEGEDWLEVAETLNDEMKIQALKGKDEKQKLSLIRTIRNSDVMLKAIDCLEGDYKEVLKRLYKKNNKVVQNIDVRILDKNYIETLGEDKINLISCYLDIQSEVLRLREKEYKIFSKCIENYLEKKETEEWTTIAWNILNSLKSRKYDELIENIEDLEKIDIDKLSKIMQLPNEFEINNVEDIKNYEKIKKQKCDEIINGDNDIEKKKKAVFWKLFGQDLDYIKKIIEKYGEDIESIDESDEKNYVLALKAIMEVEDEHLLKEIYDNCEEIGIIDKTIIERDLKTAYGKLFNEGLYKIREDDIIQEEKLPESLKGLGLKVYDAGTDFKMIITSVAPYVSCDIENYKKDWNRPDIASQHFCASYIRNDMTGTAHIIHICYGFSNMKEDALMFSAPKDIASLGSYFISQTVGKERYYTPDKQINETTDYNEMGFRRIQNGVKKQPDYIVAFKENGKITNIEQIIKAAKDWDRELPIVIVDKDKCLESKKALSENKRKEKNKKELKQNYDNISMKEKNEGITVIKRLYNKLQDIIEEKEGGQIGK